MDMLNIKVVSTFLLIKILSLDAQDPAIVVLTGRVNQLELQETITTTNLTTLNSRYNGLRNTFFNDLDGFDILIAQVAKNLSDINLEVVANADALAGTAVNIAGIDVDSLNAKIAKLQSVNLIWQKNFRVVNKTFSELRRKVTFVAPYRLLRVIPFGAVGPVVVKKQNKKPVIKKPVVKKTIFKKPVIKKKPIAKGR